MPVCESEQEIFMSEMFPVTIEDEITELNRELGMRRQVYSRLVGEGKMPQAKADRQIAVMESAVESLHRLKGLEK